MADDDQEDCFLARMGFEESRIEGEMLFVEDGKELLDYLRRQNGSSSSEKAPHPDRILQLTANTSCRFRVISHLKL